MRAHDNFTVKNMNKYKLNSVFTKIFISYICILILLVLSSGFTYYYIRDILIKKEISTNRDYLNQIARRVDKEFFHLEESIYGFLQDTKNISRIQDIYSTSKQYEIAGELSRFKSNFELVEKCFLYNIDLPFVLSNDGSIDKSLMYKMFQTDVVEDEKRYEIKKIIEESKDFQIITMIEDDSQPIKDAHSASKYVLGLVANLNYSNNNSRMLVTVDEENIRSVIEDTNIVDYGYIFIVDGEQNILSSSKADKVFGKFNKEVLELLKEENNREHHLIYNNNLIVFEKSSFSEMYYITVIPYNNLLSNLKVIRNIFIYVLCIIILIGILIAFIFSNLYYNPIANLISGFRPELAIGGPEKDEFSAIKNIFENLQIKSRRYEENDMLLQMLLNGEVVNGAEKLFKYKSYQVIVVYSKMPQEIYPCVHGFIKTNVQNGIDVRLVKDNEYGFTIILNFNQFEKDQILTYVYDLQTYIQSKKNIFIAAGIGTICHDMIELRNSYENAILAIKYGDSSNENCIYETNTEAYKSCSIYFPVEFEAAVNYSIYKGNKESLSYYIDDIFERNEEIPNFHMQNLVVEFINTYLNQATKLGYSPDIEEISNFIQNEYRINHLNEYIKKIYISLIDEDKIETDRTKEVGDFVINYIQRNYSDPNITIEGIASELELSSAYVSTLFKKSTGNVFSQYLQEYRLNKAKELLENTEDKVKDVSEHVGFGTYNNFAKAFRKNFGISPSDYRNNVKEFSS